MRIRRGCGSGGFDRFKKITDCSTLPKSLPASQKRHEIRVHTASENFSRKPRLPRSSTPAAEPSKLFDAASNPDARQSKSNRKIGWTALALVVGTLAYSYWGGEPIDRAGNDTYISSSDTSKKIFSGIILPEVNVRTSPELLDDTNARNDCARVGEKIDVAVAPVMIDHQDTENGPWIGFDKEYLPKDVQNGCRHDADGILWISSRYVMSPSEAV